MSQTSAKCRWLVCWFLLFQSVAVAQTNQNSNSLSDFDQKIFIAVASALLGFLGNYVVDLVKKRREPRQELSFDLQITDPLIDVASQVTDKVRVNYGTSEVRNIYYVVFNLENTGNRVVKGQYV